MDGVIHGLAEGLLRLNGVGVELAESVICTVCADVPRGEVRDNRLVDERS